MFASGVSWPTLATGYFHRLLSIGTVWATTRASRLGMLAVQPSSTRGLRDPLRLPQRG